MFAGRSWAGLNERERADFAVAALVLAVITAALALNDSDPDLWGRILYAKDAFASGIAFARTDPYSYTAPGHAWIDHEWGFSWIAFVLHSIGGFPLIRISRIALAWSALAIAGRSVLSRPLPKGFLPIVAVIVIPPLFVGFGGPRAQAISFVCFAWMLRCLSRDRVLLAVAPFPMWANIHGGFLAGWGVLGVWGVIRMLEALRAGDRRAAIHLVLAALWSGGSAFATIWGPTFPFFLIRTAMMDRPYVTEWTGFHPFTTVGLYTMALVAIAAWTLIAATPRLPWRDAGATAVTALAALNAHRHTPFLVLSVLVFVLPRTRDLLAARAAAAPEGDMSALRVPRLFVSALAGLALAASLWITLRPAPGEPDFPVRAVEWMRERHAGGNVLVHFDWSQYVLFHLRPDVKVAFDGRFEAAYPTEVGELYWANHVDEGEGRDTLVNDSRTERVLVKNGTLPEERMAKRPDWTTEYRDELATLFVRAPMAAGTGGAPAR